MSVIKPFRGLLPTVENAEKVAAVPYDVVNSEEAAELAEGNALSFLRVARPEIELEPGIDLHDDRVYSKAAENFKRLIAEAPLLFDDSEHLYVYYLEMNGHSQIGIVGAASTEDYSNDIIKKHEKTRKDKEDDRTRHIMTLRSHTGPVFLTYRDNNQIDAMVNEVMSSSPALFDFTAPDGIIHRLWRVTVEKSREISAVFANNIDYLYIADGHHRAAAATRTAARLRQENPNHSGDEDYNFFLTVTFPASQLQILPYNRAVHDLNGRDSQQVLKEIEQNFTVTATTEPSPSEPGQICMYLNGSWSLLEPKFDIQSLGVIDQLDVSILQNYVLAPILGIDDPRTSKRIDFVGGIRGTAELEKLVANGRAEIAFSMYPTTVEQLIAIADAGAIMPPKSTWFEPKLRDGLVCHCF